MRNDCCRFNHRKIAAKPNQVLVNCISPSNVTTKEMEVQISVAFEQWKKNYLTEIQTTPRLYYIANDDKGNTVSEALGFGLLTMVSMAFFNLDTKDYFDGMFLYSKQHPSLGNPSLMAWRQVRNANGTMTDELLGNNNSAADGDMDIAYSLILADRLWGSEGKINYKQEANKIITALMDSVVNKSEWTLKLGDWVKDEDVKYGTASRTSDWMIGHLKLFYQETGDERWKRVIVKIVEMISFFQETYSPKTGLLPDFVWKKNGEYQPVHSYFLEGQYDNSYYYNACRLPWRLAVGYYLFPDSIVKRQLARINVWIKGFTGLDPEKIMAGYHLDGSPLSKYSDMAFISPFAVSAAIDIENQTWLNNLWERMTKTYETSHDSNYYNDCLRLLSMISIFSFTTNILID